MAETPVIELRHFIQAIRDAGYKGTASAIAELVDNSFEAHATAVHISIDSFLESQITQISVTDNGSGMTPATIKTALQFGGSSRFDSRDGAGRYGMGLPNSSVSQARRLEVYSWTSSANVYWSYLDVDEIISGAIYKIPDPEKRQKPTLPFNQLNSRHGTIVQWFKCDRLSYKQVDPLKELLLKELGRTFRKQLWQGKAISINGERVQSVDPLFLIKGNNLIGALTYGSILEYKIKIPSQYEDGSTSKVRIVFSELPVEQWHSFSNKQKRAYGISKNAGVSIVRAGREIDHGWYFMGEKRKENYDDWWRCEVEFSPELDELFGVTHTKQGINPLPELQVILTPDMEAAAHKLNARVRSKFISLKVGIERPSERRASECDVFFEPPFASKIEPTNHNSKRSWKYGGLTYTLKVRPSGDNSFYKSSIRRNKLSVVLNDSHPFVQRFYGPLNKDKSKESRITKKYLELLLFAAARAEKQITHDKKVPILIKFNKAWSDILSAYLS